jgi:hypothetical protein
VNNRAGLACNWFVKNRPGMNKGMELAVLTAWIYARGQGGEKL